MRTKIVQLGTPAKSPSAAFYEYPATAKMMKHLTKEEAAAVKAEMDRLWVDMTSEKHG